MCVFFPHFLLVVSQQFNLHVILLPSRVLVCPVAVYYNYNNILPVCAARTYIMYICAAASAHAAAENVNMRARVYYYYLRRRGRVRDDEFCNFSTNP